MLDRALRPAAVALVFSLVACAGGSAPEGAQPIAPVAASEPTSSTEETRAAAAPVDQAPNASPAPAAVEAPPKVEAEGATPDPIVVERAFLMSLVHQAVARKMAPLGSAEFTSWAYQEARITELPLPTSVAMQGCGPSTAGSALDIHAGNFDTTEGALRPGDLLYVRGGDSSQIGQVVVWTGALADEGAAPSWENPHIVVASDPKEGLSYRRFDGELRASLTHARRIIGTSDPAIAESEFRFRAEPGSIGRVVASPPSGGSFEATPSSCERR